MCLVTKHTFKRCVCGRIQRCHSASAAGSVDRSGAAEEWAKVFMLPMKSCQKWLILNKLQEENEQN